MYHPMYHSPTPLRATQPRPMPQNEIGIPGASLSAKPSSENQKDEEKKSLPEKKDSTIKSPMEEEIETTNDNTQTIESFSAAKNPQINSLRKDLENIENSISFQNTGIVDLSCDKNSSHRPKISGNDDIKILKDWLIKSKSKIRILKLSGNQLTERESVLGTYNHAESVYGPLTAINSKPTTLSFHNANLLARGLEESPDLLELDLHATGLVPKESLKILSALESSKNIRYLDWSYNVLDFNCCRIIGILVTQTNSQLRFLNISHCQLDPQGVSHLLRNLKTKHHHLRELSMESHELNQEQALILLSILQTHPSLISVKVNFERDVCNEDKIKIQQQIEENKRQVLVKVNQLVTNDKLYDQAVDAIKNDNKIWLKFLLGTKNNFENEKRSIFEKQLGEIEFEKAIIEFEINFLEKKIEILENMKNNPNFDYRTTVEKYFEVCLNKVLENQKYLLHGKEKSSYFGNIYIDPKNNVQREKAFNKLKYVLTAKFGLNQADNLQSYDLILTSENSSILKLEPKVIILIKVDDLRLKAYWMENGQTMRPILIEITPDQQEELFPHNKTHEGTRLIRSRNTQFHEKVISSCKSIRFQIDASTDKRLLLENLKLHLAENGNDLDKIFTESTKFGTQIQLYEASTLKRHQSLEENKYSLPSEYLDVIEEILEHFRVNQFVLDSNTHSNNKNSLLLVAAEMNNTEAAKLLLNAGVNPFQKNANGKSTFRHILDKTDRNSTERWILQQVFKKPEELWGPIFNNEFIPESFRSKINNIKEKIDNYLNKIMSRQKWSWLSLNFLLIASNLENRKEALEIYYSGIYKIHTDILRINDYLKEIKTEIKPTFGPLGRSELYQTVSQAIDELENYLKTDGVHVEQTFESIRLTEAEIKSFKDKNVGSNNNEIRQLKEELEKQQQISEQKLLEERKSREKDKIELEAKFKIEMENKERQSQAEKAEMKAKLDAQERQRQEEKAEMEAKLKEQQKKTENLSKQMELLFKMVQSKQESSQKTEEKGSSNTQLEDEKTTPRLSTARNSFYAENNNTLTRDSVATTPALATTITTEQSISSTSTSLTG